MADPDNWEKELCRFTDDECDPKMSIGDIVAGPEVRMKWCQNCLMGQLVREIRRLRITGIQP